MNKNKNIRRGVVALATAFAVVVALASPASAATLSGTITGGIIHLTNSTGTATDTVTLVPTTTTLGTNCSRNIKVEANNSTTSTTTWQITTFSTRGRFQLSGTGTYYIATLTSRVPTTGTNSTIGTVTDVANSTDTTSTLNTVTLSLDALIQNTNAQSSTDTDCTTTTTKCRFSNVNIGLQGTYTGGTGGGTAHDPAISDTVSFTGAGTLGAAFAGCTAPFTTYSNGTVTTSTGTTGPITAHVTCVSATSAC